MTSNKDSKEIKGRVADPKVEAPETVFLFVCLFFMELNLIYSIILASSIAHSDSIFF